MRLRVLTWNLFHGRDFPPDPSLFTARSRLLRTTERNETHVQVNRDLRDEFVELIAAERWDVALLQECPPRWATTLAERCQAQAHAALTSRNSLAPLRALAAGINPDLVGSNEGGCNLTLAREATGGIADRRELVVTPGPRPERRVLAFARLGCGVCVANLHASASRASRAVAEGELRLAAERSVGWAEGAPLILGGDLNVRPRDSEVYVDLDERFGLAAPTGPASLDHLLATGLTGVVAPAPCPAARREITLENGLRVRLSDHAPVTAEFAIPG